MNCYIKSQSDNSPLPEGINKDNTLFYPESGMTTLELHETARPKDYHIITDSHFLVPLYSSHEVFVYIDNEWINPDVQTYGMSYNLVLIRLFGIRSTIPRAVLNGEVTNCMGFKII